MIDKVSHDLNMYDDLQSIQGINAEYQTNADQAKTHTAQQFASMFMQMVLTSMRNANKAFNSELSGSQESETYQGMFDQQMALVLAGQNTSLTQLFKQNMNQHLFHEPATQTSPSIVPTEDVKPNLKVLPKEQRAKATEQSAPAASSLPSALQQAGKIPDTTPFTSQEEFVRALWPAAQVAAKSLKVKPDLLIAQAALETNWGKSIIGSPQQGNSNNLFNIKADANWHKPSVSATTLEEQDNVLVQKKDKFRHYTSLQDSFMDYVHFLKNNSRYEQALHNASQPRQFIESLQKAGFATDSHYSEKVMQIFDSKNFKNIFKQLHLLA